MGHLGLNLEAALALAERGESQGRLLVPELAKYLELFQEERCCLN